jgi:hypothetical protein
LAALNVRRLVLIDADQMEAQNFVGMIGTSAADVGRPDLAVTTFPSDFADACDCVRDVDLLVAAMSQVASRLP